MFRIHIDEICTNICLILIIDHVHCVYALHLAAVFYFCTSSFVIRSSHLCLLLEIS